MPAPDEKPASGIAPEPAIAKGRKQRSRMIALGLIVFVLTIYAVTILKIGGNILERPF